MTLRTKLLWQFAPPLLLVLGLTFFATHNVLLERLDKQDERLLVSEAKRVRALLNNLFERDADRLEQLAESLPRPIASAFPLPSHILNRTDFDFLALVTPTGQRSAWRTMAPVFSDTGNSKPLSFESLQSEVSSQLGRLSSSMASASSPQLMVVHRQPFILATVDVGPQCTGNSVCGRFLDAERNDGLERQLGAVLQWETGGVQSVASPADGEFISIGNRQISDERHQRIDLIFHNSLGEPQVQLQLHRERHLYSEGIQQLKLLMGAMFAIISLAWLVIYLALDVTLLRRISALNREFLAVGADSASGRLSDSGHDELGMLAQEANRTLDRLEQSEARGRIILDGMEDGYFELDSHARIQSMNPAFCKMLCYSAADVTGNTFAALQPQEHGSRPSSRVVFDTEPGAPLSARLQRADGTVGYYETRFTRITDAAGNVIGYRGILHDVSEHVQYQQALLDMAYRDALTGLGNRKAFHEQLERLLDAQRLPLGVVFLDLDRFKQVNDRFGHDVGDALLVCMAERLRNAMRKQDTAYRLGGDEFTAILPAIDEAAAGALAERLLAVLSAPVRVGEVDRFRHAEYRSCVRACACLQCEHAGEGGRPGTYQAKQQRGRVCLAN